jgi:hypothetical protein
MRAKPKTPSEIVACLYLGQSCYKWAIQKTKLFSLMFERLTAKPFFGFILAMLALTLCRQIFQA